MSWLTGLMVVVRTISQILAAGIAITAFSLLLYTTGFNLKDRVARSFVMILICVVIIFTADAIGSTTQIASEVEFWLRMQWIGMVFLPPAYLHFSDALLATTGKPSRGKRRWAIRITYLVSIGFLFSIPASWFLGSLDPREGSPTRFLQQFLMGSFILYYSLSMIASWINFTRAFRRTTTPTTRRRIGYLITGAIAPVFGSIPYLFFGSAFASEHNLTYWFVVMIANLFAGGLIVGMAYSVAFFGVSWPDRVVKRRLFKWIMRGPVTAIITLGLTTILRRAMENFSIPLATWIPIAMVMIILLMEYFITVFAPYWEKWLFYGKDYAEIDLMTDLGDRLMTRNDLRQFLETVLAAVSDRFQTTSSFIASLEDSKLSMIVNTGKQHYLDSDQFREILLGKQSEESLTDPILRWNGHTLVPLWNSQEEPRRLVGLLGMELREGETVNPDDRPVLLALCDRIITALQNRDLQSDIFQMIQRVNPKVEQFQIMRAETRFARAEELAESDYSVPPELTNMVKDALTHFWGGPKLSESPLLRMSVVQSTLSNEDQSPVNALRAVLRQAIEKIKPEGDRRYTGEWILYNILDLKFIQGKKVREVAMKLAMSEADLYRKQRVAIESVAKSIMEMDNQVE